MLTTITTAPKMKASTAGKFGVSWSFWSFPPSRKITPRTEFGKTATLAGAGGCRVQTPLEISPRLGIVAVTALLRRRIGENIETKSWQVTVGPEMAMTSSGISRETAGNP